ncbi:MAG: hypothetical protein ACLGIB_08130 [Actinomycetota bacterium]
MAETKRCPHCGGSNPVNAEWCGQCHASFVEPKPEPEPEPPVATPAVAVQGAEGDAAAVAGAAAEAAGAPGPPPPTAAVGTRHGAFAVREQGVVWTCDRCDNENPLDSPVCAVCGTSFAEVMRPPVERVERDPGTAALISLFFPGAGHGYLGMWGQAIARGVLSLWVLFVVLVSLLQRSGGSTLIAGVFGLAAFGLWAIAAHDAYREAQHQPGAVILKGKVFLYLVLGLLGLLMILLVATGLSGRAG